MPVEREADRSISVEEAARSLGVEPAAVRMFVKLQMLRPHAGDPLAIRQSDVRRLGRVLSRRTPTATPLGV